MNVSSQGRIFYRSRKTQIAGAYSFYFRAEECQVRFQNFDVKFLNIAI